MLPETVAQTDEQTLPILIYIDHFVKDDTRVAVTATSILTDDRSLIPTLYTNVLFSVRWAVWTLQTRQEHAQ